MATDDDQESSFNSNRRLCPDGSCVGIIGSNGKCTVCGLGAHDAPEDAVEEAVDRSNDDEPDDSPGRSSDPEDEAGATFDPHRRLCSDGDCIGIISADNRCSVCGKQVES